MIGVVLGLAALLLSPPPVEEHFPREGMPYVFLVVDTGTGGTIRADNPGAARDSAYAPGESGRILLALAGLEEGTLDPDRAIACDSTCWAEGRHGDVRLLDAFALGCDAYFRVARARVGGAAIAKHADRVGFGGSRPSARAIDDAIDFPGPGWSVTARQWVGFWRRLAAGNVGERITTSSTLLAAAGISVSSPRGAARSLSNPRRRVRALAGGGPDGAWVTGVAQSYGAREWAFALFLPDGGAPLASARADHLLRETLRVFGSSTFDRGGEPLPDPENTFR
jgi:hypothetical protein